MSSSVSAAITWRWKSATDIGDSAKRRSRPSDFRIRNAWCAKSNSMSKMLSPAGIGDVVSPFAVTWRDRKSVVSGKSVSGRVDLGGRRIIKTKKNKNTKKQNE